MELAGSIITNGTPERVWAMLINPEVLRQCIPGCSALDNVEENKFLGKMAVKVGPVTASFSGAVSLSDMDYPRRCTLEGQGQGGPAGFVKGNAVITLERVPEGTHLEYTAQLQIGGKMASVGNRLFGSVAKRNIEEFFARFEALLQSEEGNGLPS